MSVAFHYIFCHCMFLMLGVLTRPRACSTGATTQRMINPIAWERGLVFAQCGNCEVWHNIRDAAGLIQEYRFTEVEGRR